MAPPREYEWSREINAIASPSPSLSLPPSHCYLFTFHSVSTQPLRVLWQTEGGQLQMDTIAPSVFFDASMQRKSNVIVMLFVMVQVNL